MATVTHIGLAPTGSVPGLVPSGQLPLPPMAVPMLAVLMGRTVRPRPGRPRRVAIRPDLVAGMSAETVRRLAEMLTECPPHARPVTRAEARAAAALEPAWRAMHDMLAGPVDMAAGRGWAMALGAACAAAGTGPGGLAGTVHRLAAIASRVLHAEILPAHEGLCDPEAAPADMQLAAARILWLGLPLDACLVAADAAEREGTLPRSLSLAGPEAWRRLVRREAIELWGDPLGFESEVPASVRRR